MERLKVLRASMLVLAFILALGWPSPVSDETAHLNPPPAADDSGSTVAGKAVAHEGLPETADEPAPNASDPGEPGSAFSPTPAIPRSTPAGRPADASRRVVVTPKTLPSGSVPILMYHYIRVNPDPSDRLGYGLSVSPSDFQAQMAFLAERGYRSVLLRDLAAEAARSPTEKLVAITFDDGYADAYLEAYPVLRRYGFQATFYVITGLVGQGNYLTWEQILALANEGSAIGSHTVTHRDLTRLGNVSLHRELEESRAELERRLGRPVTDFCYPSGRYDSAVKRVAGEAGYRTAVTTRFGYVSRGDDPLAMPRVRVSGGMSLAQFAEALGEEAMDVVGLAAPAASRKVGVASRAASSTGVTLRAPSGEAPTSAPGGPASGRALVAPAQKVGPE